MKPLPVINRSAIDRLRDLGIAVRFVEPGYVEVEGIRLKIVERAEAEESAMVVCATTPPREKGYLATWTECADCKTPVCFNASICPKKPPKVCFDCAIKRMEAK